MKWLRAWLERLARRLGWKRSGSDGQDGSDIYPLW
jgi:hypothetical protein